MIASHLSPTLSRRHNIILTKAAAAVESSSKSQNFIPSHIDTICEYNVHDVKNMYHQNIQYTWNFVFYILPH